jgi:hypothetical protein
MCNEKRLNNRAAKVGIIPITATPHTFDDHGHSKSNHNDNNGIGATIRNDATSRSEEATSIAGRGGMQAVIGNGGMNGNGIDLATLAFVPTMTLTRSSATPS